MYIEESIWGYVIMIVMIWSLDFYTRRMRGGRDEVQYVRKYNKIKTNQANEQGLFPATQ